MEGFKTFFIFIFLLSVSPLGKYPFTFCTRDTIEIYRISTKVSNVCLFDGCHQNTRRRSLTSYGDNSKMLYLPSLSVPVITGTKNGVDSNKNLTEDLSKCIQNYKHVLCLGILLKVNVCKAWQFT